MKRYTCTAHASTHVLTPPPKVWRRTARLTLGDYTLSLPTCRIAKGSADTPYTAHDKLNGLVRQCGIVQHSGIVRLSAAKATGLPASLQADCFGRSNAMN